ncbi:MAG: protein translocase subunit SecF [Cryobacterium sp.]|nr:protein translocase subunit SecF [Micrococcales bacterium]MBX3078109.1 protein translocase subunit SecF [Cryobacterium sp.]MBX3309450.1 protein translocase subunit SecF [Cryobacterium sp.]MCB1280386.1 protein translocase subunit SecF [Salinibacterium sp.]HNP16534.1 protein translocase subunit SecF [Terrimesophilobacter sp.]
MASFAQFGNDLYTGKRSYDFVGKKYLWYTIAFVMIALALGITLLRGGFEFGIEFSGGSQFEISQATNLNQKFASDAVIKEVPSANPRVTIIGGDSVRIQTDQLTNAQNDQVRDALAAAYQLAPEDVTASYIGATWGADITSTAIRGLITFLVLAAIVMAIYFRTWKMSLAAMIALLHDLVITAGVYGVLQFEVTPAAVIGFLTILGYSLYDTVVVFDKIRENTSEDGADSRRTFSESVNLAVNQTLVRSINTSVVALLPVGGILFIGAALLGAGTLRDISLALFIGMLVGTYSTIFIAAPLYAHLRSSEDAISKNEKKILQARNRAAVTAE